MVTVLKTSAEIAHLRETIETTLDRDRDGVVSNAELADNYALADDELKSYGIDGTNARALHFFTTKYQPGTEVELTADGEYVQTNAPQSLRAESLTAYENGDLMDAALNAEGVNVATALQILLPMEDKWLALHDRSSFNPKTVRNDFAKYSEKSSWEEMGLDPATVADKFTADDLHSLYDGVLLMKFISQEKILYDKEQVSFSKFLKGRQRADMSDMTGQRQQTVHDGTCTVVVTWALHLLKLIENKNFKVMIISDHVTLCVSTSQGPIYLDPAAGMGFQPPSYYDNRSIKERIRRGREDPAEPWQVLSAVYGNIAAGFMNSGNSAMAEKYYQAALEIYPEDVTTHCDYGNLLKRRGDKSGARAHYNKALAINPHYERAKKALLQLSDISE